MSRQHGIQAVAAVAALEKERERLESGWDQARSFIADELGRTKALRELARFVAEVAFEGNDVCGGDVQDRMVELGLLVAVEGGYDPETHGEHDCEPGDLFYVFGPALGGDS